MNYDILLGDRLSVILGERRCVSDVQEITREGTLIISAPTYKSAIMPLHEKDIIKVLYFRDVGMLSFFANVARIFTEGDLSFAEIEIVSKITKEQIRDYARVEALVPVRLHIQEDEQSDGYPEGLFLETVTKDISAGGFSIASMRGVDKGKVFLCEFSIDKKTERVEAVVVRSDFDSTSKQSLYLNCFTFIHVPESTRKVFVKYVFKRQREQRGILSKQ